MIGPILRPTVATAPYVILELDAEDEAAIVFSPKVERNRPPPWYRNGPAFRTCPGSLSARHDPAYQHPSEKI